MSCSSERVSAYVDRELPPLVEHQVARHLAACPACAAQAVFEVELASTLAELPPARPRPGFAARVMEAALSRAVSAGC